MILLLFINYLNYFSLFVFKFRMLSKSVLLNIIVFSPSKVSLKIVFQKHQKKDTF